MSTSTQETSFFNTTSIYISTTTAIYENAGPVSLLFVFGVFGNAIALTVLCFSAKRHKWRPFYRFVCGLAISDGGGILFSYPFVVYRYISEFTYTFPKPLCDYLAFFFMFTLMSSAMIVCCMSFDRFFATFLPLAYKTGATKRANILLGIIWTTAAFLSSLHIFGLGSSRNYYPGSWCFLDFIKKSPSKVAYAYLYSITGIIVVLTTIVVNILVIIFFVRHIFQNKKRKRKDLHVILFLIMLVAVFTSCWLPLMINILQHATGVITKDEEGVTELNLLRMGVLNSVIDPWIYILFRLRSLSLMCRCCRRVNKIGLKQPSDTTPSHNQAATDSTDRRSSTTKQSEFIMPVPSSGGQE